MHIYIYNSIVLRINIRKEMKLYTLIKYNTSFIKNLSLDSYNKLIYRFHWEMGFNEKRIFTIPISYYFTPFKLGTNITFAISSSIILLFFLINFIRT